MFFFFILFAIKDVLSENETNSTDNNEGNTNLTCKTGACDILMIIFGIIGCCCIVAYVIIVIRYNKQSKEETTPISSSLVQ